MVDHGLCPDWIRPPHRRRRDSIYLILDGTGHITIDGRTIYPQKNDMVLLPKNSVVSLYAEKETCYNKYWCDFTMQVDGVPLFQMIDFSCLIHLDDITHPKELFERLDVLRLKADAKSALQLKMTLLELVTMFLENSRQTIKQQKKDDNFADYAKEYIHTHLSEKLSVKRLAKEMNFNEKYFIEVFKQNFSTTPAQYIKSLRLEMAKQELLYSDDTITNMISRIGYVNQQELAKDFKAYTGLSPSAFRKKYK